MLERPMISPSLLRKIHQKPCPRFRSMHDLAEKSAVTPSPRFDMIVSELSRPAALQGEL